jgi:hypothetical protein
MKTMIREGKRQIALGVRFSLCSFFSSTDRLLYQPHPPILLRQHQVLLPLLLRLLVEFNLILKLSLIPRDSATYLVPLPLLSRTLLSLLPHLGRPTHQSLQQLKKPTTSPGSALTALLRLLHGQENTLLLQRRRERCRTLRRVR